MEELSREELCRQLQIADAAMPFFRLLIVAGILAWKGAVIRRMDLCDMLSGKSKGFRNLLQIRLGRNAIVVASLFFFFCAALDEWKGSKGMDETAQYTSRLHLWAALLALAATLIELYDLICCQSAQPELEGLFLD